MSQHPDDSVEKYRFRLLATLIKEDIDWVMDEFGFDYARESCLQNRYTILGNWNHDIEKYVFKVIRKRLREKKHANQFDRL